MIVPAYDVRTPEMFGLHGFDAQAAAADFVRLGAIVAAPRDASARLEHCMISWALADALGISPGVGLAEQVKVHVSASDDQLSSGRSFFYTVSGTFWTFPPKHEIRFHPDEGAQIGGARRLYGGDPPDVAFATVWR